MDYKFFTSILSQRLDEVLPELVHQDQTGLIRQRQTQGNIRRSLYIIRHITQYGVKAAFIGLDA